MTRRLREAPRRRHAHADRLAGTTFDLGVGVQKDVAQPNRELLQLCAQRPFTEHHQPRRPSSAETRPSCMSAPAVRS